MVIKKKVDFAETGYIKWFSELSNQDVSIAGGKGASLAEMYNSKFPVPQGFVVTVQAFDYFLTKQGIKEKINEIIKKVDFENIDQLNKVSREVRDLIEHQKLPEELEAEILESYHILSSEKLESSMGVSQDALNILKHSYEPAFVSVRSSATTEDLAGASFAGQQESFLNVKGDRALIIKIKECFSSLYTPRAIYYRNKQGFSEVESLLAAVVQKMVDSQKSGVMFSRNPVGDSEEIVIEAVFGLGEGIVSGQIKPDHFVISRDLEIKSAEIFEKKIAIVRTGSGENALVKLSPEKSKSQTLTNSEITQLANYGLKLEEHYKKAQDIEFAIDNDKIYLVQSRPITTLNKERKAGSSITGTPVLLGMGASPGVSVGTVRIINHMADLARIKKGDVLVTQMTNPDMVVAMEKSVAIVTDEGGITSHASIVSREMGIPCVVGTNNATTILKEGEKITVDGTNGKVFEGEVSKTQLVEVKPALPTSRIKIKVILDLPDYASRAAKSGIKAVGLLRLEGIISSSGKHPLLYEHENSLNEYTELLRIGMEKIEDYFDNIWIRTSDIRTDEFDLLNGAPQKELNPMLGLHGIRFSLKHPKIFEAELLAIKQLAEKHPKKKFGVMFPQIISVEEVIAAKKYFDKYKLDNMDFGVMIETPAAVQVIDEICETGIQFISFGTNDLTQFTLAVDRGNQDAQYLYNEFHPAIFSQIKRVIGACRRHKVETSICGQAGSKKEMVEFLFRKGINSVSVNADVAYDVSVLITNLEKEFEESKSASNNSSNNPPNKQVILEDKTSPMPDIVDSNRVNLNDFKIDKEKGESLIEPIDNLENIKKDGWEKEQEVEEEQNKKLQEMGQAEDNIESEVYEID